MDAQPDLADHAQLRRVGAAWLFCNERLTIVGEEIALGEGRIADVLGMRTARRVVPWSQAARVAYPGLSRAERYARPRRALEIPSAPEFRLIEVKTSRRDFLAGLAKSQISNGPGSLGDRADYAYLLCPWGLVRPDELPEGWGLLWHFQGKVEQVAWCAREHSGPHKRARAALVKPGAAMDWFDAYAPADACHPVVVPSRSRDGFKWPLDKERHRLLRIATARRLHPSTPLTDRADIFRAAITESALWRLYGERSIIGPDPE